MRKKALWKDFYMEIKKSLNRFLSIFFIVALGVAFFAGIRATDPDMRITADSYFDNGKLMDIRILSTMGLTDNDVKAIEKIEGVNTVEPTYSLDTLCEAGGSELVLKVMSLTKNINLYSVTKGRLPQKNNEVMVDTYFIHNTGYKIGDKIKLTSGTNENLSTSMKNEEFTIVGIGATPYYLSFQRGTTDIGNGKINSFIVVLPQVFNMKAYTTIYATVKGASEKTAYTDKYNDTIKPVLERIKKIAAPQCQNRYEELYQPNYNKLQSSKKELMDARTKAATESQTAIKNIQKAGLSPEAFQTALQVLQSKKLDAEKKFAEAQKEIDNAEIELNMIKKPTWYVLDRNSIEAYVEFEQNADRIGAIGKVFPAIFFLVAALISLTTMTRMVEEERLQIGILKALGYSKISIARKYILYALLATLGGSLFGAAVGLKVLPIVIITAYKILYVGIPEVIAPFNFYHAAIATGLSVLCVGLATFFACYKELLSKPANLMRPDAPKIGKRVLLEKIPLIWNRLSFTWKATVRNLFRYKKRFGMTIIGIGGCMSLLLVGYGLKDSIFVIYTRQFDEIMIYDATVSLDSKGTNAQKSDLEQEMNQNKDITSWARTRNEAVDISSNGVTKSVSMYIPEKPSELKKYIVLRNRVGHKTHSLDDSGVILSEQVAKKLGVKVGDSITIKEGDKEGNLKISAITENYMTHYLYMTPELYQKAFGKEIEYNEYFLLMPGLNEKQELEVGNHLLQYDAANGVFYTSYYQNLLSNVLVSLNIVVLVLIISAGALAFVVLYNLNNININERRRELATIKVLGFYHSEMAAYVYRENIVLTILGAVCGIFMGMLLHHNVIITVEVDMLMFGRNINLSSYIYSFLLTILFSIFVNFVMYFKLKKINMVESLKSVE